MVKPTALVIRTTAEERAREVKWSENESKAKMKKRQFEQMKWIFWLCCFFQSKKNRNTRLVSNKYPPPYKLQLKRINFHSWMHFYVIRWLKIHVSWFPLLICFGSGSGSGYQPVILQQRKDPTVHKYRIRYIASLLRTIPPPPQKMKFMKWGRGNSEKK